MNRESATRHDRPGARRWRRCDAGHRGVAQRLDPRCFLHRASSAGRRSCGSRGGRRARSETAAGCPPAAEVGRAPRARSPATEPWRLLKPRLGLLTRPVRIRPSNLNDARSTIYIALFQREQLRGAKPVRAANTTIAERDPAARSATDLRRTRTAAAPGSVAQDSAPRAWPRSRRSTSTQPRDSAPAAAPRSPRSGALPERSAATRRPARRELGKNAHHRAGGRLTSSQRSFATVTR